MIHPLQWEAVPRDAATLVPLDLTVLEDAALLVPYCEHGDEMTVDEVARNFLEQYHERSSDQPYILDTFLGKTFVPSPIWFQPRYGIKNIEDTTPELYIWDERKQVMAGWLMALYTPDEEAIAEIINEIKLPYILARRDPDTAEDLEVGLWAKFCLKPPVTEVLWRVAPKMLCPIPGTLFFEFGEEPQEQDWTGIL
jgi:hypothetical protein